jgi:hypothetical protein
MPPKAKKSDRESPVVRRPGLKATVNDLPVFDLLQRYLLLPKHFIDVMAPPNSVSYRNHRLGDLRESGFLSMPHTLFHHRYARSNPHSYENTDLSRAFLDSKRMLKRQYLRNDSVYHRLSCCMVMASMEIGITKRPALSFQDFAPVRFPIKGAQYIAPSGARFQLDHELEHDWHPRRITYTRPDGAKRSLNILGVEIDMDTEGKHTEDVKRQSIHRKFVSTLWCFDNDVYEKTLGVKTGVVIYYFTSYSRMKNMEDELRTLTRGEGSDHILFAQIPNISKLDDYPPADDTALTLSYERVGSHPLGILQTLGYPETTSGRTD